MAVLEKIRVKFGLGASIIIAIGLLTFIIGPNDLMNSINALSTQNDVGEINGKSIAYPDFQREVDKYTTLNEMMTGSSVLNDQQQQQIRNLAWQSLISKYLFIPNAEDAGINVGNAEILALTTGDMVSPMISNNPMFMDEEGNFSVERLQQFVSNLNMDQSGRMKLYWDNLQNSLYVNQFQSKYYSLFMNSQVENPLMLRKAINENNTTTNVDFVMVPYSYQKDSSIVISNSECKKFYNSHKKFFKQQANRDAEYVVYEVVPSDDDIIACSNELEEIYDEFATTDKMQNFLLRNSDRPYSDYFYKEGELNTVSSEINDFVFGDNEGTSKIFRKNNDFFAARILDVKKLPDSVYVSHILLENDAHLADSLLNVLKKGSNFSNIASLYSKDTNSAADGQLGNIGWMTQTYMIPGFESVLEAKLNKPYIIDTQYGKHIVEVTKRTKPILKKKVAILEKETLPSKETFNSYYNEANKFATLATGGYKNYRAAVDSMGVYSHPMKGITEATRNYGSIENAKELTRWIFESKKGKVSNIITVNNNYFFVATVKDIHDEGYASFDEVKPAIENRLYADKYAAKRAAEVAEQIAGMTDLNKIAEKLNTTVSHKDNVAFASLTSQGLDPKFIGAASVAEPGKIQSPLAGTIGVYVYRVNGRDTGDFYTEEDAKNNLARATQYSLQMIVPLMSTDVVTDNRARFY